jgi:hypothetical protein
MTKQSRKNRHAQKKHQNTKTLFLPYFKNKTTLVEQKITHTANLITLLFIASGLLRRCAPRNDEIKMSRRDKYL